LRGRWQRCGLAARSPVKRWRLNTLETYEILTDSRSAICPTGIASSAARNTRSRKSWAYGWPLFQATALSGDAQNRSPMDRTQGVCRNPQSAHGWDSGQRESALVVMLALPATFCGIVTILFIVGTSLRVPSLTGAIMAVGRCLGEFQRMAYPGLQRPAHKSNAAMPHYHRATIDPCLSNRSRTSRPTRSRDGEFR
jgi:hypothetical protein